MFKKNIFVVGKRDYILGIDRPQVECILCTVLFGDHPGVKNLSIWEDSLLAVSANLYPYNAGHLLLFPRRHLTDIREMTDEESLRMIQLTRHSMDILDRTYAPHGYNLGYNIHDASGASIEHLHQHVIPRYPKELGFVDVVAGAKIIIEDPQVTMNKLRQAFSENPPPEFKAVKRRVKKGPTGSV